MVNHKNLSVLVSHKIIVLLNVREHSEIRWYDNRPSTKFENFLVDFFPIRINRPFIDFGFGLDSVYRGHTLDYVTCS